MIFDEGADYELDELPGEATRMLDGDLGSSPFGGGGALTPFGAGPRPSAPTLTPQSPSSPQTQILDTSGLGVAPIEPFEDTTRPPLASTLATTDVLPRSNAAAETGKFAMPPIPGDAPAKSKLELPPKRTLIMLGVTIGVALIGLVLIMVRKGQREEEAEEAMRAATQNQTAQAEAALAVVRERIDRTRTAREEIEARYLSDNEARITEVLAAARATALEGLDDEVTPEDTETATRNAERDALEKLGVDALGSNSYPLAFACFQRLAREYPGGPYAGMLAVVRAKLHCVGPEGRPCAR